MNFTTPIILASSSPRRQELLRAAGFDFVVKKPEIDEQWPSHLELRKVPVYLAQQKAMKLLDQKVDGVILAADTVVILEQSLLGKPQNSEEAHSMLLHLSGKTHEVVTGICLLNTEKMVLLEDSTSVKFKNLTTAEINYYIEHYQPFDKAGAYGIQEWLGMIAVEEIRGSYYNVMGLPVHKVYQALKQW